MMKTIVSSSSSHHLFSSLNPSSPSRANLTWQQPTNLHLPPPLPPHPGHHLSSFAAAAAPQQTPLQIRRSLFTLMAASNDNSFQWAQLNNESDFEFLLTPSSSSSDRFLSICGFGSLLSERSARSTFPELTNFRVAKLNGFRRVFAHVAPIFFDRGIANPQTQEISSLSVEPCEGSETLVVTVFEIKESEIPSFIEREHEFRFLAVVPETLQGSPYSTPAVLCGRYSDEEYFQIRCKGMSLHTQQKSLVAEKGRIEDRVTATTHSGMRKYDQKHPKKRPQWRYFCCNYDDRLLRLCNEAAHLLAFCGKNSVLAGQWLSPPPWLMDVVNPEGETPTARGARRLILSDMDVIISIRYGGTTFCHAGFIFDTAKNLGNEAYNNFLDHTFLGDRETTIREYFATKGAGIMEEEPPELLKIRYGG